MSSDPDTGANSPRSALSILALAFALTVGPIVIVSVLTSCFLGP